MDTINTADAAKFKLELLGIPEVDPEREKGYTSIHSAHAKLVGESRGYKVVFPKDNELQIDIDNNYDCNKFAKVFDFMETIISIKSIHSTPSKTPDHQHITIVLRDPVTPLERIALQAILCSDYKREILGYRDYKAGDNTPTLFYEKQNNIFSQYK